MNVLLGAAIAFCLRAAFAYWDADRKGRNVEAPRSAVASPTSRD